MKEEDIDTIKRMRAVTISREYGSGGGEIAARLARRLGWQLVDHAVIERTAQELNVYATEVEKHDEEYVQSTLSRIQNRIRQLAPAAFVTSAGGPSIYTSQPQAAQTQAYQDTLRDIITAAADSGHVVIVGRAGQVLLTEKRDVLHIRVVAPLQLRVAYVARREGLDLDAAGRRVQAKDRARTRYMKAQHN